MLRVNGNISIDESELSEQFVQSGGPGGQNVNKVATTVQLRFNLLESQSFSQHQRRLLLEKLTGQLTASGELIVEAHNHRTQRRNREAAREKLAALLRKALYRPAKRRPTKPTAGSVKRRLDSKKRQSQKKQLRRSDSTN